jgi:uncharacterized protein YlxW (UPF0749 family)
VTTPPEPGRDDEEITLPLVPAVAPDAGSDAALDAEETQRLARPAEPVAESEPTDEEPAGEEPAEGESTEGESTEREADPEDTRPVTAPPAAPPAKRKMSAASVVIAVLVGLLGFALIVQVRGTSTDSTLASARTDDLVRILSDLDSNEGRVRQEIEDLEQLKRDLTAGSESAQAARQAAEQRADELGILAGTLPAQGPGLTVRFSGPIRASRILDAVEELRNAGAEAMQITGGGGQAVRIIVSTYFEDADGGVNVSGTKLSGPYTITVIGDPATMKTALNIPGGVVATVSSDGGNVIVEDPGKVTVSALAAEPNLQYAQPAS